MHISPTMHYNAGHNYKYRSWWIFLHGNKFSPWQDFFINPFCSVLTNYVGVHDCTYRCWKVNYARHLCNYYLWCKLMHCCILMDSELRSIAIFLRQVYRIGLLLTCCKVPKSYLLNSILTYLPSPFVNDAWFRVARHFKFPAPCAAALLFDVHVAQLRARARVFRSRHGHKRHPAPI